MKRAVAEGSAHRCWQSADVLLDGEAGLVEPVGHNAAGQRFLVAQLGMVVDPVRKFDERTMGTLGTLAGDLLGVVIGHCSNGKQLRRPGVCAGRPVLCAQQRLRADC